MNSGLCSISTPTQPVIEPLLDFAAKPCDPVLPDPNAPWKLAALFEAAKVLCAVVADRMDLIGEDEAT